MKKIKTQNTVLFSSVDTAESEDLLITAKLKNFGSVNLNGEKYAPDAFDDFINDYYVKNGYEIPLTVQHSQDVRDIIGKVTSVDKKDDGLYINAVILHTLPIFETIKTLIDAKILRGVSDEGFAMGDWISSEKEQYFNVTKAEILAVSLVTTPSEPKAKVGVKTKNLIANGFEKKGINKLLKNN